MEAAVLLQAARRQAYERSLREINDEGWQIIDKHELNSRFYFSFETADSRYARLSFEHGSLCDIFNRFFTDSLFDSIMAGISVDSWQLSGVRPRRMVPRKAYIYKVIAAYIYIMGHRGIVEGGDPNCLSLDLSMRSAINYLSQFCPEGHSAFPSEDIYCKILTEFNINYRHWAQLSLNFQSAITCLGEIAAGDEKLCHFTGDCLFKKYVLSKPDRIG